MSIDKFDKKLHSTSTGIKKAQLANKDLIDELEKTANESKDEDTNTLKIIEKLKSDRDTF